VTNRNGRAGECPHQPAGLSNQITLAAIAVLQTVVVTTHQQIIVIGIAAIQKLLARAVVVGITDDLKLTKMRSVGFEC
jgi:hypothetical protein